MWGAGLFRWLSKWRTTEMVQSAVQSLPTSMVNGVGKVPAWLSHISHTTPTVICNLNVNICKHKGLQSTPSQMVHLHSLFPLQMVAGYNKTTFWIQQDSCTYELTGNFKPQKKTLTWKGRWSLSPTPCWGAISNWWPLEGVHFSSEIANTGGSTHPEGPNPIHTPIAD